MPIGLLTRRRIALQLSLVFISAFILLIFLVGYALHLAMPERRSPRAEASAELFQIFVFADELNQLEGAARLSKLEKLNGLSDEMEFALLPGETPLSKTQDEDGHGFVPAQDLVEAGSLATRMGVSFLGYDFDFPHPPDESVNGKPGKGPWPAEIFYIGLADGVILKARLNKTKNPIGFMFRPEFILFMIAGVCLLVLLVWVVYALVRPLGMLSEAVTQFGLDNAAPVPLAEKGPQEVRELSRSFNRMQKRIEELVRRRTAMLAAIGHDLRTPLTRLRLRMELMPEDENRTRNLADLQTMQSLIDGALTFLGSGKTGEPTLRLNLSSLLLSLVDQYADCGKELDLSVSKGLSVDGRSSELTRLFSNLLDNAFRFDDQVALVGERVGDHVCVKVVDHGPGIAEADRERFLEPFGRGDDARTHSDAAVNFGLGLSISKAIAEAHDGSIELLETPGGGLTVQVRFPLAAG